MLVQILSICRSNTFPVFELEPANVYQIQFEFEEVNSEFTDDPQPLLFAVSTTFETDAIRNLM